MTGEGQSQPQLSDEELVEACRNGELPSEPVMTRFLSKLDMEQLVQDEANMSDGTKIRIVDYLDVAGAGAKQMILGFTAMSETDPEYEVTKDAMIAGFRYFVSPKQGN